MGTLLHKPMLLAYAIESMILLLLFTMPPAVGLARAGVATRAKVTDMPKQHNSTSSGMNLIRLVTPLSPPRHVVSFLSSRNNVPSKTFMPSRCICDVTRSGKPRKRRKRDCTCQNNRAQSVPFPEQLQFPNEEGTDGEAESDGDHAEEDDTLFFDDGGWLPPSERGQHYTGPLGKDHPLYEPEEEFVSVEVGPETEVEPNAPEQEYTAAQSVKTNKKHIVDKASLTKVKAPSINKARHIKVPRVHSNLVQPDAAKASQPLTDQVQIPPDQGIHVNPGYGEVHAYRYMVGAHDPADRKVHTYRYMSDEPIPVRASRAHANSIDELPKDELLDTVRTSHSHANNLDELPRDELLDAYEQPVMLPSQSLLPSRSRHYVEPVYLPSDYESDYDDEDDDDYDDYDDYDD